MISYKGDTIGFVRRDTCPVCGFRKSETLYETEYDSASFIEFVKLEPTYKKLFYADLKSGVFKGATFTVVKCVRCRFVYVIEVLNTRGMERLYDVWIDEGEAMQLHEQRNHVLLAACFARVMNMVVSRYVEVDPIHILDWGAGFGFFCDLARAYGLAVDALDLAWNRREYLKSKNIHVVERHELQSGYYHFVNLDQVIEHEPDPRALLRDIGNVLVPDGILRISAPNCSTVERLLRRGILSRETFEQVSPHQHINAFSPATLKKLCERSGFKILFEINPKSGLFEFPGGLRRFVRTMLFNVIHPLYYRLFTTTLFAQRNLDQ